MENAFKYSYRATSRESLGLAVYNCGFQKCTPGHSWGPAVRDHHLIHYVTSGQGFLRVDGAEYAISAGDAFYCAPDKMVHYWADQQDPWEYYWVGFNGAEAERIMNLTSFSAAHPVEQLGSSEQLRELLLDVTNNFGPQPFQETRMIGGLYVFLSYLMEYADRQPHGGGSGIHYVEKAAEFIARNYSHNINVEEIAAHVGVSRSHLYRVFVRHVGMSPNDYLIRFRINEACSLLRNRELTIGEISYSVGFSDQMYFSRQFKKVKGVSPSRYLESRSDETGEEPQNASASEDTEA